MLAMAEKLGTIVAVPIVATKTVHIIYEAIQGSENIYIILSAIYRVLHFFWRELDVQLLFSNLVLRTFPKGSLLTIAHKCMKALKRTINQLRVMRKCDNLPVAPG